MNERRSAEGQGPDAPAAGGLAPAPVAVDVGIVAALGLEVGFLIDQLSGVRKYSGPRHTVIEGECAGKLQAPGQVSVARRGVAELVDDLAELT